MPTRWTSADLAAKTALPRQAAIEVTQPHAPPAKSRTKAAKPPQSTANQITKAAVLWLNLNGFKAYRVNNGGVWDPGKQVFRKNKNHIKGLPDIAGFHKGTGRALFIEVKAGKDRLSPEQIQFLKEAAAAGCITGVLRKASEIEEIIKSHLKAA